MAGIQVAWRLPAPGFEQAIAAVIADHLADHATRHAVLDRAEAARSGLVSERAQALDAKIVADGIRAAAPMIDSVEISRRRIQLHLSASTLGSSLSILADDLAPPLLTVDAPFTCRRRGVEIKIIAGEKSRSPDPVVLRVLRNAHRWSASLRNGTPLKTIARDVGFSESYVARVTPLACLSTPLQKALFEGTQPVELTLETLVRARLPLDWSTQERLLRISV